MEFDLSQLVHREFDFIKLDVGVWENGKIKKKKKSRADAFLSAGQCEGQRWRGLFGDAVLPLYCRNEETSSQ